VVLADLARDQRGLPDARDCELIESIAGPLLFLDLFLKR